MSWPLCFSIREGRTHNRFYKDDAVAAHVLARSGRQPRLVAALAAGNEGAGLWFEAGDSPVQLELTEALEPAGGAGGRGITAKLRADVHRLGLERAALGSVRLIRVAEWDHQAAAGARITFEERPGELTLRREVGQGRRLTLRLEPLAGTTVTLDGARPVLISRHSVHVRITLLGQAAPLTPVPPEQLLRPGVEVSDEAHLRALAFLTFEEKLLAGSWRFLTYFGRDTLLAARLLAPALRPRVMEAALGSVLERLGRDGQVAHEEEIGDWAWSRHGTEGPALDYKMVDDDFLLAPVAAHHLLGAPDRAEAFLQRRGPGGERYRDTLVRNLELVLRRTAPFAADPDLRHLIAIGEGLAIGNWRDSEDGLGGGRVPFDVNAALVPAALHAAARLYEELLCDGAAAARAQSAARIWERAWDLFEVRLDEATARRRVEARAAAAGVDPGPALESINGEQRFSALALDDHGQPLPVMHTDGAFALLLGRPSPARLNQVAALTRPWPAGLLTAAGVLVASPALAGSKLWARFTKNHYHGEVVWSWHHALLAAGLARQLERADLPRPTRATLRQAEAAVWRVMDRTRPLQGSELWSWMVEDGALEAEAFGGRGEHLTESNAVQLWSTVYLALSRPR